MAASSLFAPYGSLSSGGKIPSFYFVHSVPIVTYAPQRPAAATRATTTTGPGNVAAARPRAWPRLLEVWDKATSATDARRTRHPGLPPPLFGTTFSPAGSSWSSLSALPDNTLLDLDDKESESPSSLSLSSSTGSFPGAEWAGWECRFSGLDGGRVAVPEDYVPESLREWDVEVWGFETLTSEQRREYEGGKEGVIYRKRGRVYPEVGCALDNLSLEVNVQSSPLEGDGVFFATFPGGSYLLAKKPEGSTASQLEAGLVVAGRHFGDAPQKAEDGAEDDGSEGEQSRLRVELRVDGNHNDDGGIVGGAQEGGLVLGKTLTVTRERKYGQGFEDGGGLDSQRLSHVLRSKCFGEEEDAPTAAELAGKWRSNPGTWKVFSDSVEEGGGAPVSDTPPPLPQSEQEIQQPRKKNIRSASFWEKNAPGIISAGVGREGGGEAEGKPPSSVSLLLRGGVTLRAGPWGIGVDSDDETWGAAAGATAAAAVAGAVHGRSKGLLGAAAGGAWAVEVGWLVEEEGVVGVNKKRVGGGEEEGGVDDGF